ncbi:MAG: hypothetical protein ACE5HT_15815 [Gemmatimonadales bacterium]
MPERVLGDIHLMTDWFPTVKFKRPKLDDLKPGTDEAFYMLATYCFVLALKMEYMCKVTERFADNADPALARDLLKAYDAMEACSTWEERARWAEGAMREVYREIGDRHATNVRNKAAQGEEKGN